MVGNNPAENVNSSFFDGHYKNIWRHIFPEKTTIAEVDFIMSVGELAKGKRVLDLMCGYGRHSIGLAQRGIKVTAIDNLTDYIEEIRSKALQLDLEIICEVADVSKLQLDDQYDVVICMGNSLQFFNYEDMLSIVSNVASYQKRGGKLIVNTWSILEIVSKNFQANGWSRIDNLLFLNDSTWYFQPTRIETSSIIIDENGNREEKKGIDYIYSISELDGLFRRGGYIIRDIFSIPGRKRFSFGDPRAYIVAERM